MGSILYLKKADDLFNFVQKFPWHSKTTEVHGIHLSENRRFRQETIIAKLRNRLLA